MFGQPTRQAIASAWNRAVDAGAESVILWLAGDGSAQ